MRTIVENARIVISLLKSHNIKHVVLSPGGSNIPIVQGIQSDPFFKCYSVVDERSAMYVAIGIYLQTGEIVATSCTSAQATRNYVPGLTEAFYKHVPILAITMSKHPRYLGQEYMQCPVQTSLPIDAVKKSYNLPIISNDNDRMLCVRTVNEAILELTHHSLGPVQLNIEALDSETWVLDKEQVIEPVRVIKRYNKVSELNLSGKKILLLIGEHMPFSDRLKQSIDSFCECYDVVVYTTHLSNYKGRYAVNGVRCLSGATDGYFNEFLKPDIIISIGGVTGDYTFFNRITRMSEKEIEVWRISSDGNIIDTYGNLTTVYEMNDEDFFESSIGESSCSHQFYASWEKSDSDLNGLDLPFSNIYAAQQLHSLIPESSNLNFAILNSFRSWLYFDVHPSVKCFCNVGAFGIDGCMSTMLGQSFTTDQECFLITGDLAFYYDINSLAIRHIKSNVHILLVNNNGGAEFKLGKLQNEVDVSSYISADNHFKNAEHWAIANGFEYLQASTKEDFLNLLDRFVSKNEKPVIFEIFTSSQDEKIALDKIFAESWKGTSSEEKERKIKSNLKNIINRFK